MFDNEIILVFTFLWTHFLADFVFQSHWMATNKSKSLLALFLHVLSYTAVWIAMGLIFVVVTANNMQDLEWNFNIFLDLFWFFPMTFAAHFGTDYLTSRWTSYLWKKKDVHYFFVVIGFDQFLHLFTLYLTLRFVTQW